MKRSEPRAFARNSALTMAFAIAGAFATVAGAQEAAPPPTGTATTTDKDAVQLDKVEVTGSRIRRVQAEGPSPVKVIGRDEIEKSGYINVQDVLNDLTQNTGGNSDQSITFGFAASAASVDLRGFGSGRTLILLDGRRMPTYPIGLGGTDQFVDIATIPASQIERIEVLTDGASAIYGSDAISGVVNIITRKDMQGSYASARVGGTEHGGAANQRYQFLTGSTIGKLSTVFNAEYYHQNELMFTDRKYAKSDFTRGGIGSTFGSNFIVYSPRPNIPDPNCGTPDDALGGLGVPFVHPAAGPVCGFDRAPYRQFEPEIDRASGSLRLDRKFDDFSAYSRVSYSQSKTRSQSEPNAYSGGEGFNVTDPFGQIIPFTEHNFGYVDKYAPNNPTNPRNSPPQNDPGTFTRRLVEYGPRGNEYDNRAFQSLIGLQGDINLYHWDVGVSYNIVKVTNRQPNIISSLLDEAVDTFNADGTLETGENINMFDPIPQSVIDRTKFEALQKARSRNFLTDATLTGPVGFSLPGGPVQFAAHADFQHEKYNDASDPLSTLGDAFDGSSAGGGSRDYYAFGLELNFPILSNLEAGIAGRYDKYDDRSDVDDAFSPRVSLKYTPIESLYVRGSAGKSFRAPDLSRLFGAETSAFSGESVIDTRICNQLDALVESGALAPSGRPSGTFVQCETGVTSVAVLSGSNEALEEEKGKNWNVGFGWEIAKNLTWKVDYFWVKLKNIVTDPSEQFLLDSCADEGSFCNQILGPNPVVTPSVDGTSYTVSGDTNSDGEVLDETESLLVLVAQNLSAQRVKGVDTSLDYSFKVKDYGKFRTTLEATWIDSFTLQLTDADTPTEQIDFSSIPEWRGSFTTDWSLQNFGAYVRTTYVGAYPGALADFDAPSSEFVASWITWDLQGRYDFGKYGTVKVGIDNIFDRDLPEDPTQQGASRANQFINGSQLLFSDAWGRSAYLMYELNF